MDTVSRSEINPQEKVTPYIINGIANEWINPNSYIQSTIQIFPDFKPTKENSNKYFKELAIDDTNKDSLKKSIAVVVPFYNEEAHEIHATLRSIYENFECIKDKYPEIEPTHLNVLLVSDGWFKSDISTKKYLAKLYNTQLDNAFKEINIAAEPEHNTVILQPKNNRKVCINPFNNGTEPMFLSLTTIIKMDNRKKANSHEWFFGKFGFADWCKCEYIFLTDCYTTTSHKEGLYHMLKHMQKPTNKDVVGCTGKAAVYSKKQELQFKRDIQSTYVSVNENVKFRQNQWWENDIFVGNKNENNVVLNLIETQEESLDLEIPSKQSGCNVLSNELRHVQAFEFEAHYAFHGCYILAGFIPVLPGPCGFYRCKYLLQDQCRGYYFKTINEQNDDLISKNMKLAEDKILTHASIMHCKDNVRHTMVAECEFYFEPVTQLDTLMQQRRRWINGGLATTVYMFFSNGDFSQWNAHWFRKLYVGITQMMLCLCYFSHILSPALIFTFSFQYGLSILFEAMGFNKTTIQFTTLGLASFSWIVFLLFIYYAQSKSQSILKRLINQSIFKMGGLFTALTLLGTAVAVINPKHHGKLQSNGSFQLFIMATGTLFAIQSFILAPLYAKRRKSFFTLVRTFRYFVWYSIWYGPFLFIYAILNLHDVSWGTRPDDNDEAPTKITRNPKRITYKILTVVILVNVIIGIIVQPFGGYICTQIVLFTMITLPGVYFVFFSCLWQIKKAFRVMYKSFKIILVYYN